jgi:hypothetical protein
MKQIEIVEVESKRTKLTITPTRITIKFPIGGVNEVLMQKLLDIAKEYEDTKYSLRGPVTKNGIALRYENRRLAKQHIL